MRIILLILATIAGLAAHAELQNSKGVGDLWECTVTSTSRQGSVWHACGTAEGYIEGEARQKALEQALKEFKTLCEIDSSCNGRDFTVEPKRTSCLMNERWIKCYRGVDITVH